MRCPVSEETARNQGAQRRRAKADAPPRGGFLADAERRLRFFGFGRDKVQPPIWATSPARVVFGAG